MNKMDRIGEISISNKNEKMKIIEYISSSEILVEFENGFKKWTNMSNFKRGNVKNLLTPSLYAVGYLGVGEYSPKGKAYTKFRAMYDRCYGTNKSNDIYKKHKILVCEEWHNFQNFAKWYENNYYEVNNETMCLDKDLLSKNTIEYSPQTCVFLPKRINSALVYSKDEKITNVYKHNNKFRAICRTNKNKYKSNHLGLYETKEEAYRQYKIAKSIQLQSIVKEYKGLIPSYIYNALISYAKEFVV